MKATRRMARDEGTTVLELTIVLTLLGMIVGVAYLAMGAMNKASDGLDARQQAAEQNRVAVERMTREMRQAVETSEGMGVFASAAGRQCSFYSDTDQDGVPEMLSYRVASGWLYRQVTESSTHVPPYVFNQPQTETVIVKSIDPGWAGDIFTYWDNSDPPQQVDGSHSAAISAVDIRLIDSTTAGRETATEDLSTWVKIRSVHNTID